MVTLSLLSSVVVNIDCYLHKHLYYLFLLLCVLLGHKCLQNKQNPFSPPGGSPDSDFKTTHIKHKLAHLFTLIEIKQDYSGNIKKHTFRFTCCLHPSHPPPPENPERDTHQRSPDCLSVCVSVCLHPPCLTLAYFSASSLTSLGTSVCRPFVTEKKQKAALALLP